MSFGSYLKEKREASGLTAVQIAKRMKITQPYVSQLENDFRFPSQKQLPALAKAYGLSPEEVHQHWTEGKIRSVSLGTEYKFNVKDVGHRVPMLDSIQPIKDLDKRVAEARSFYSMPRESIPSGPRARRCGYPFRRLRYHRHRCHSEEWRHCDRLDAGR